MRSFSFSLAGQADFAPTPPNAHPPSQPLPGQSVAPRRRRLEDAVEDLFYTALERGDLAAAEDLVGVIESIRDRTSLLLKTDRGSTRMTIERARRELASRRRRRPGRI